MRSVQLLLVAVVSALLGACASAPNEPYYQASAAQPFDYTQQATFADYVAHSRTQLLAHRVFFQPSQSAQELEQVAPRIYPLPAHCGKPRQGVLLVHGLLDTAYALDDMGQVLAQRCLRVFSLLLPGHGTRPADLIHTTRHEWLAAVRFGVRALAQEVDDVTVIGYSLGGLLATQVATETQGQGRSIRRLVLLAPALEVAYPTLSRIATFYRYVSDWVDVDPHHIPVRYQSMPTQAVAETFLLSREVQRRLHTQPLSQPVFMLLSADDLVIDAQAALHIFNQAMPNAQSQAWVYGRLPQAKIPLHKTVRHIDVYDPAHKIVNFSHVALTYAPDNPVFGQQGSHRECGQHIGLVKKEDAQACLQTTDTWKGEIGTQSANQKPFQRLTYHPRFDEMMHTVLIFIEKP